MKMPSRGYPNHARYMIGRKEKSKSGVQEERRIVFMLRHERPCDLVF